MGARSVSYDAASGSYVAVDTMDLLSANGYKNGFVLSDLPNGNVPLDNGEDDGSFKVNQGIGIVLSSEEKNGFVLLCTLGGGGLLILGYVYFFIVRKKDRKN